MRWEEILAGNVTTLDELSASIPQINEYGDIASKVLNKYPMSIPRYYLSLVNPDDANDPIRKMCIPSFLEMDLAGTFDTSGESSNTKLQGLQHKYPQTVLMLSTNRCAMYCRYCFRKRMVGSGTQEVVADIKEAISYILKHEEITNVLISGGDSFLLDTDIIREYLDSLSAIGHLDYIRFGTKTPVVFPQRILEDSRLKDILREYGHKKQIYIVTQFNHPRELTEDSISAVRCLQGLGLIVKNQTVLLKGVNDCPETLARLFRRFTELGIIPYYIFQCRPVTGVMNQFQVPLQAGYDIIEQAKAMQNGNGKCFRFVLSNPDGKIEILGRTADGQMVFKYHQAKDPDNLGRVFQREVGPDICWIE